MNLAEARRTGNRACAAGLYRQAVPASGFPVQYPLCIHPRTPSRGIHIPWTTALLSPLNGHLVMSSQERKIKFCIVPPFPNSDPLVIDAFSLKDSYGLLACLILPCLSKGWLGFPPGWGGAGCWFFLLAIFGSDSGSWQGNDLWGCLLGACGRLILPEIFTVCPSRKVIRYLEGLF